MHLVDIHNHIHHHVKLIKEANTAVNALSTEDGILSTYHEHYEQMTFSIFPREDCHGVSREYEVGGVMFKIDIRISDKDKNKAVERILEALK